MKNIFYPTDQILKLIYFRRLHGSISFDEAKAFAEYSSFKKNEHYAKRLIQSLIRRGLVHMDGEALYLTPHGLRRIETKDNFIKGLSYGFLLQYKFMPREKFEAFIRGLNKKITNDKNALKPSLIIHRLKRDGIIDYTREKIWIVNPEIKLRKEE